MAARDNRGRFTSGAGTTATPPAGGGRTFADLLKDLEALDLEERGREAIRETAEDIKELNVDQLRHGETSEGDRLQSYRPRRGKYAHVKHGMNPLPGLGNPDYILTGAFTEAITVEVTTAGVFIHSYDQKAPKLEAREGREGADRIYGLGEDRHNVYVAESLAPAFIAKIAQALKLKPE